MTIQLETMSKRAMMKNIGKRIVAERVARNLTQERLAEESNVSTRTVHAIESGENTTLDKLMSVLGAMQLNRLFATLMPEPKVETPYDRYRAMKAGQHMQIGQ